MNSIKPIRKHFAPLFLVLLAVLLYFPFIDSPPFFDDLNYFSEFDYFIKEAFLFAPRSIPRWTISRTFEFFGTSPDAFRIASLAIHAAVAIALFFLIRRLIEIARPGLNSELPAFVGALLFTVHPVAAFATGYIIQRTVLMAMLFSLLAWSAFLRGNTTGRPIWLYASALCFLLACLSKEHAVTAYAVFPILLIWLKRSGALMPINSKMRLHLILSFLLYSLVAASVIAGKAGIFFVPFEPNVAYLIEDLPIDKNLAYPLSIMSQMGLFFKYWFLWLVPNTSWMSVDMREPFAESLLSWPYTAFPLVFSIYIALSAALLWRGGIKGLVGVLLLVPALMFATEITTVRIQDPFVLYRSYLWMPLSYALAVAIVFSYAGRRVALSLFVMVAIALSLFTVNQLITFSQPVFIWNQAVEATEGRAGLIGLDRIYHNRGQAYYDLQMTNDAMKDYNKAIELEPDIPYSYVNRGALLFDLNKYQQAMDDFNRALSMVPARNAYMGRGMVLDALGRHEEAIKDYVESCNKGMEQACRKLPATRARNAAVSTP